MNGGDNSERGDRGDKSRSGAEAVRKRRRDKDGLRTGLSGSTRERNWVVGSQILTGVACMQPSSVPRRKYPDRCEQEQSHLRQFAKFGLAGEETDNKGSASDSAHAEEFRFGVGYKRNGHHIHNGGCVLSPLASGESGGTSG